MSKGAPSDIIDGKATRDLKEGECIYVDTVELLKMTPEPEQSFIEITRQHAYSLSEFD